MNILPKESTTIIAEIGINHEGDVRTCADLIRAAADAGADAVKLQTVDADASYVEGTESHRIFKKYSLTRLETEEMFSLAKKLGIGIFSTVGDAKTVDWMVKLEPDAWKVSSGLLTHIPLITKLSGLAQPLFISTGMAEKGEIDTIVDIVKRQNKQEVVLFQCTSIYPTPAEMLHLRAIRWMSDEYGLSVGFSDHSVGVETSGFAVTAGAVAIEKHFTFDSSRPGVDHHISLDPFMFRNMVDRIRSVEIMLGRPEKIIGSEIRKVREDMLRCVVAARPLEKGIKLRVSDLAIKRPRLNQRGIAPNELDDVMEKELVENLETDDPITFDVLV